MAPAPGMSSQLTMTHRGEIMTHPYKIGGIVAALIAGTLLSAGAAKATQSPPAPYHPAAGVRLLTAQSPAAYAFVVDPGTNSVIEYAKGANGNQAPVATISGSRTGLNNPTSAAVDPAGDLFVTNPGNGSIAEFAPGANGDVAPIATISGATDPVGLTLDPAGDLFVAEGNHDEVAEYAKGAKGDAAPITTISGVAARLDAAVGVALDSAGDVFVADDGDNSVTEYAQGANGDVAPVATISGPATGLSDPTGVALDSAGDLFVASNDGPVTEYAQGANGDVAPVATISGPATGLNAPTGVALDSAGDLFVANFGGPVTEYAKGANGNVAPIAAFSGPATGLALAPAPAYSFVANAGANSVTAYARGADGSRQVPAAIIQGPDTGLDAPTAVAVNPAGDLFVADDNDNSVTEYAPRAFGDAAPIATISGAATGLSGPFGLALDSAGDLFVGNAGNNSVTEYAPRPFGDVAPIATISGPDTGLNSPFGVALDSAGDLFVANDGASSVTEFAKGANGDAAPIVTISGAASGLSSPTGVAVNSAGDLYVVSSATDSVNEYEGLPGHIVLVGAIGGAATGLSEPGGIAVDPAGNLFVTNMGANSMTEYAADARGNEAPDATLAGPLSIPFGVALLPPPTVPGVPLIGTATAGNASATITFSPPWSDGGSPVTSYTVTAADLTHPAHGGQTATRTGSPLTVTGLANGDTYTLSVTATNAVGTGPRSGASNRVTPHAPAPTLSVSPGQGAAGTKISITGQGFQPKTTIVIHLDSSTGTRLATVTAGPTGKISLAARIPATTYGTHSALAVGSGRTLARASFKVLAAVAVSPATATSGTVVHATLSGFRAGQAITIRLNSATGTVMAHAKAASDGKATTSFLAPARPGGYWIYATTSAGPEARATLTVQRS
jgi:Fibronectin type III domain